MVGKKEPVRIYELLGPTGEVSAAEVELADDLKKDLTAYRAEKWEAAERQFHRCIEVKAADGPSALYIERIAELRKQPPPPNWGGVWHLDKN